MCSCNAFVGDLLLANGEVELFLGSNFSSPPRLSLPWLDTSQYLGGCSPVGMARAFLAVGTASRFKIFVVDLVSGSIVSTSSVTMSAPISPQWTIMNPFGCNSTHLIAFFVNNQSPAPGPVFLGSVVVSSGASHLHTSFAQSKTIQVMDGEVTYNDDATRAFVMFSTLGPPFQGVLYSHDLTRNISSSFPWIAPVPKSSLFGVYESPVVVDNDTVAVVLIGGGGPQCPQMCIFSSSLCLWNITSNTISNPVTPLRQQNGYISSAGAFWQNNSYVHILNPQNTALYLFESISNQGFIEGPVVFGKDGAAPYTFLNK